MNNSRNAVFLSKVSRLLKVQEISKNKMLTDLKLVRSSFVDWKRNGTIPSGETLLKIANYFNVSIDYLLGNTDKKEKPHADNDVELKDYEVEVIEAYRALAPEAKKIVLRSLGLELDEKEL